MSKLTKLAEFQPARLTEARNAKKLTIPELAEKLDISRQVVYAYEKGEQKPSAQTMRLLSQELGVPESFFLLPLRSSEQKIQSAVNFRSLKSKTLRARHQASTYLKWLVSLQDFASEHVEVPKVSLPDFNHLDFTKLSEDDIEALAEKTRQHFGLGNGPLEDLTKLLELKGVFVGYVELEQGLDGLSAWFNGRPYILVSSTAYHARARFDLAHELFHLIAHKGVTEEELEDKDFLDMIEKQAHRFAGAFLAPNKTYMREVYSFDFDALVEQKKRWGISVQAQISRFFDLGVISESQKIRFFSRINVLSWRRKEPLDGEVSPERPTLLKKIAEFLEEHRALFGNDFISEAGLPLWFIESVSGLKPKYHTVSDNVIQFRAVKK